MSSGWKQADHDNAAVVRARLQQGPANRNQLADLVGDVIKLGLALGLLRELGEIESIPPLDTPEQRRRPRIYSLRAAARLEPVAAPFADAPYEGEDEREDTGIPEVPEDVPGIAAAGRWASKAPPPPGPRPPSRSMSGVLVVSR